MRGSDNPDPEVRAAANRMLMDAGHEVEGYVRKKGIQVTWGRAAGILVFVCALWAMIYVIEANDEALPGAKRFLVSLPEVQQVIGGSPDVSVGSATLSDGRRTYRLTAHGNGSAISLLIEAQRNPDGGWAYAKR